MNSCRLVLCVVIFASVHSSFLWAREKASAPTKETCLAFVRNFYGWYVPKARTETLNSDDAALKARRSAFSQRLLKGLQAVDEDAKLNQEAGLDFDWILNSQDPGDLGDPDYLVRNARVTGNACRVDVARQRSDRKTERIVPELNFAAGGWVFVNFYYPDSTSPESENLLNMIRVYLNAAACDGVKQGLTSDRKAALARSIALQLHSNGVDVLQSFQFATWEVLHVDTHEADEAYLFYAQDPSTNHYVTLWSGTARKTEERSIKAWTIKHAPGIPPKLATCFARHVTHH